MKKGNWLRTLFLVVVIITAVVLGSVLYKLCIQIAMSLGLPTNMLKLVTAVLFLLVLVVSGRKGEEIIHA